MFSSIVLLVVCLACTSAFMATRTHTRSTSLSMSTLSRASVIKSVDKSDKDSFATTIYGNADMETFIRDSKTRMHTGLRRYVYKKANSLGLDAKKDFAAKPVPPPPVVEEEAAAEGEEPAAE
jgi:hypothetical protein